MIILTLLYYFCALLSFIILGWYVHIQKYTKYLKNIPGPPSLPLLGNALLFRKPEKILHTIGELTKSYGNICRVFVSVQLVVIISDYKCLENILSSTRLIEKSRLYNFIHSWVGTGLLTSSGAKWKARRRLLTPAYHFQILEQFIPIFDRIGNNLIDELTQIKQNANFDIYPLITLSTLDIICETVMGVSINALQTKDSSYIKSVKEMARIAIQRAFSATDQFDFLYAFTKNYRLEQKCLKVLHNHTKSVIKKRREEIVAQNKNESINEYGTKKRIAFLDLLLQANESGTPMSDDDIREEDDTFMFEGHDTTSSGISFALLLIAHHPEVQAKILEEQIMIFDKEERPVTQSDSAEMKYLEMVIKESLRLYPSVPIIAREAFEDVQITDNVRLPRGCIIAILPYWIHRMPEYFDDPETFNPERFHPGNNIGKMPYSYIPFSAGPRNCIGQKFAMLEMKTIISKIVRRFQLLPAIPAHIPNLVAEAVLKSNNGVVIKLQVRSYK